MVRKKIINIFICLIVVVLVSCGIKKEGNIDSVVVETKESVQSEIDLVETSETNVDKEIEEELKKEKLNEDGTYEVALVTSYQGVEDGTFSACVYKGLKRYADENNITYKVLNAVSDEFDSYLVTFDNAVEGGSKLVICTGSYFEEVVFAMQDRYEDVKFVLIDGEPHNKEKTQYKTNANCLPVSFANMEAGFLAGYSAVKEGYKDIGFMGGMKVLAVKEFGYGYIYGANEAAKELDENININYTYNNTFFPSVDIQKKATDWYKSGIKVIFACGGEMGKSVMYAAEDMEILNNDDTCRVIGVDVDQYNDSDKVVISAIKKLEEVTYEILTRYYKNTFDGIETMHESLENNGVGLSMEHSRYVNFSKEDYDKIVDKLIKEEISMMVVESNTNENPEKVLKNLTNIKINYFE